jgi:putative membrane-bound dehydrogenase-like protein
MVAGSRRASCLRCIAGWVVAALGMASASMIMAADRPVPTVPEGFEIEVAAAFPQIHRPIFADFDQEGRLYVGESSGDNLNRAQMLERRPHWITRLEDTDGDGFFEKSTRFAEQLTLPQGMLCVGNSVYLTCPPSIWKLTDTDGDGVADEQTEILTGFGFNGNACDTHGPFLSPNGRLYIVQGRHGHEFKNAEGQVYSRGKAGRIYSCKLDGSDVRVHAGGGFDNPVELEFGDAGELIGTVNILFPQRGDCLMQWVEGGVYPREDQADCIAEFPWTGGLLDPVHDLGHVAVSGITRMATDRLGPEFAGQFFFTEFNTHKVKRATLARSGSSFAADVQEFLTSTDTDFHPTDVLQDADGSLLVVDTGAWFLNGCPTSRVSKPEVTGAVYRIRRTGVTPLSNPRGQEQQWDRLTAKDVTRLLDDPRPAVRRRAQARLVSLPAGKQAISELLASHTASTTSRRSAVFLALQSGMDRHSLWTALLHDTSDDVRLAAWHCVGWQPAARTWLPEVGWPAATAPAEEWRQAWESWAWLSSGASADGSEIPQKYWQQGLNTLAAASVTDRLVEHAAIVALTRWRPIETLTWGLDHELPVVQRICLVALDQVAASPLTAPQVTAVLSTGDSGLQRLALAVLAHHDGWGATALEQVQGWLDSGDLSEERRAAVLAFLLGQSGDAAVQNFVGEYWQALLISNSAHHQQLKSLIWEVLQRSTVPEWPAVWVPALRTAFATSDVEVQRAALRVIQSRGLAEFDELLDGLANQTDVPSLVRCEAMSARAPRLSATPDNWLTVLLERLTSADVEPVEQSSLAKTLADLPWNDEQLQRIATVMPRFSPLSLPFALRAFLRGSDEAVGLKLISVLEATPVASGLSPEEVSAVVRRYPDAVQLAAKPFLASLGVDLSAQLARLRELEAATQDGDAQLGKAVFFGKKAACATCHAIGPQGGRIGPHLTTIGASRSPRDLLEAVVYPSASFVNGYQSYVAELASGRVVQGVISAESTDSITLRTADLQEVRIPRADIETLTESRTSIMPKGLETQLTADELKHLLAYLQQLK